MFRWGGGLPREWVGGKKFSMSFETQGNQSFGREFPGFLPGCPGGAGILLRKKSFCSFVGPYSGTTIGRKILEISQQELFSPNFRLGKLTFQNPKDNACPYPQPSHTSTRLPPTFPFKIYLFIWVHACGMALQGWRVDCQS